MIIIIITILFVGTRISIAGMSEKDRSRIGIADWYQYATNGKKWHQSWNVSWHRSTCKSQQQVHERLWPRQRILYWDDNNLYRWAISQKLSVDGFKWRKYWFRFDEELVQNYDEDSNKGYILEIDVKYPKELQKLGSDLQLLPKKWRLISVENLYKICITRKTSQEKFHRVIEYNQEAWFKPYLGMNPELRIKAKNDFERDFFKLMNKSVFRKTMENLRKYQDIKFVTANIKA